MNTRTASALATLAIMLAGTTSTSAMFVVYRRVWNLSTDEIGAVFAAYVCTLLPVLLVFGGIADRIGRRGAVALGLALALGGLAVLLLASGLGGLVAARLLQGAGMGIASGALTAAITETHRGTLAPGTWNAVASGTGIFVGPLVTAIAYDLGAGVHAAYLPMLVLTVASTVLLLQLAPRGSATPGSAAAETPYAPEVVRRAMAFALAVTFVGWAGVALYLSMVPAFLAATLRAHDPVIGAGVISALQLSGVVAAVSVRTIVPAREGFVAPLVVVVGLVTLVGGTALHGIAAWVLVGLSTVLVGAAGSIAFATGVVVATRVCRGQRARIFSRVFVAAYLAFSVPALVVGAIAARSSLAIGFAAVITVLAALVAALPALHARARLDAVPA